MNLYIMTGLSVIAAAGLFSFLIVRLTLRARSGDYGADSCGEFSIEAYRPMERLLDESDYLFLQRQPGFRASIAQELRAERIKIFRMYLRDMVGDFNSLIKLAKIMLVYSPQDRPDLAFAISRLQYEFYWNVLVTEMVIALAPWIRVRTSASNLIALLDRVRLSVQESSAVAGPELVRALSANS